MHPANGPPSDGGLIRHASGLVYIVILTAIPVAHAPDDVVVDGACQIKIKSKALVETKADQKHSNAFLSEAQRSKCGSGLARECGGSVSACVTGTPPSRASPLPQVDRVQPPPPHCFCSSVGAGLPAMQAPRSVRYTGLMPSQASQLPHLIEFSFQDQVGCQAAVLCF